MVKGSANMFDKNTSGIKISHPSDITADVVLSVNPMIMNIQLMLIAKNIMMQKERTKAGNPASDLKPKI
jgi:hypothetical protein